jgi:hypothetical protein
VEVVGGSLRDGKERGEGLLATLLFPIPDDDTVRRDRHPRGGHWRKEHDEKR